MNEEYQLKKLSKFVEYRTYIHKAFNLDAPEVTDCPVEQADYLFFLTHMPVSKMSVFADTEWDFNNDYPNAARGILGAKQRIDFSKYPNVPPFIIIEMKVLIHFIHLNPLIFQPEQTGKRIQGKVKLKINTILEQFKSGLRYLNTLFELANKLYGKEHIQDSITSIAAICSNDYREAAKCHDFAYDAALKRFFEYLKHPYTKKHILGGSIPGLDLDTFEWKVVSGRGTIDKEQILPNNSFEALSAKSSALIADFLQAMEEDICDQRSLKYLNSKPERQSKEIGLSVKIFNAYRVLRLRAKGYSEEFISRYPIPHWLFEDGMLMCHKRLYSVSRTVYEVNPLRLFLNKVYYACVYIVGQYTGMRPSELSEVIVEDCQCLKQEGDYWLSRTF